MKTLHQPSLTTYLIHRSRFLGFLFPCSSVDELSILLKKIRKQAPKATHYCYAYRFTTGSEKSNDDGEPSGTAGLPLLAALQHYDLQNVLLVVARYYGGIKLGPGGLIRAYRETAEQMLQQADVHYYGELPHYAIQTEHTLFPLLLRELLPPRFRLISVHYDTVLPTAKIACKETELKVLAAQFHQRLTIEDHGIQTAEISEEMESLYK